jgi:hypothetical protein
MYIPRLSDDYRHLSNLERNHVLCEWITQTVSQYLYLRVFSSSWQLGRPCCLFCSWYDSKILHSVCPAHPIHPYFIALIMFDGRSVYGVGLWPFACWDCGFECRRGKVWSSLVFVVCCVGSGLCDELITPLEHSYRMCVCACACVRSRNLNRGGLVRTGLLCHRRQHDLVMIFLDVPYVLILHVGRETLRSVISQFTINRRNLSGRRVTAVTEVKVRLQKREQHREGSAHRSREADCVCVVLPACLKWAKVKLLMVVQIQNLVQLGCWHSAAQGFDELSDCVLLVRVRTQTATISKHKGLPQTRGSFQTRV